MWTIAVMIGSTPDNDGRLSHSITTFEYPYDLIEELGYDVIDVDEDRKIIYMDGGDE